MDLLNFENKLEVVDLDRPIRGRLYEEFKLPCFKMTHD